MALAVPAWPRTPAAVEVQERARAVLSKPGFQRELPAHAEPAEEEGLRQTSGFQGGVPPVALPAVGAVSLLARTVFVILLVVAVLLLVFWMVSLVVQGRRRAAAPAGQEKPAAGDPEREPSFEEATRLAAEGRFAEAVHALLLAAIRHFAQRSRTAVEPSRTSRELIRLLPLGRETRDVFAELVAMVELSLFGGAPVGREEYEQSLDRFRALTRGAA